MAAKYTDTITTNSGSSVSGGVVRAKNAGGAYVTLYRDPNLSQPIGTQATADSNGLVEVYVPDGTYTIEQSSGGATVSLPNVELYDLSTLASTSSGAVANKAQASAVGVAGTAENMGSYTGSILSPNQTTKQNIQQVATAVEARPTSAALAASTGAGLVSTVNPNVVGSSAGLVRTLGEKVGEIVSLKDLAGTPGGNDYTSFFTNRLSDYPFKTILVEQPQVVLASAGASGINNIRFIGRGDSQTTIYCPSTTGDMLTFQNAQSVFFENFALGRVASATAGRALVFSGNSSRCRASSIFGYGHKDGLIAFVGTSRTAGQVQSSNRAWDIYGADNGGRQVSFVYSQDWGAGSIWAGRVTGALGYADYGIYIEESDQGVLWGDTKVWDNGRALYIKNSNGNRISPSVRLEESRMENILLDGASRTYVGCQTHTPNKLAGLTGTYSAIRLTGASYKNKIEVPHVYSWDPANYLMKNCIEIESGCVNNLIGGGVYENATGSFVGGAGASDGTNYIVDTYPLAAADYSVDMIYALSVPAASTRSMTPAGGQASVGVIGSVPGVASYIDRVDVGASLTPGSGQSYSYQLIVNGTPVSGATTSIPNGAFSNFIAGLNVAVAALDIVEVTATNSATGAVANHRATIRYRR